jgi:hypothetical protein
MLWNMPWKNLLPPNEMTTCLTKQAVFNISLEPFVKEMKNQNLYKGSMYFMGYQEHCGMTNNITKI